MDEINILVAGDYCPIGRNSENIRKGNYQQLFGGTIDHIRNADLSIVNYECTITKFTTPIIKTGPCLKTEDKNSLKVLKDVGFDLITLANNHIRDFGDEGVLDTIEEIKKQDLMFVGAGTNIKESSKPFYIEIKEKIICVINIAENEFCSATETNPGAYTVDLINNYHTILKAKKKCDKIILIYHGGREHFQLPTPNLRKRLKFYCDLGVDAIVMHHSHCFSGWEYYNHKPIVYGIGNFLFDYKKKYQKGLWTEGFICKLKISNTIGIEYVPFFQGRRESPEIVLMNDEEKTKIFNRVKEINLILNDNVKYNTHWNSYLKTQKSRYLANLYFKNRYIREIFARGYVPYLFKHQDSIKLNLNMNRCETHNEIMTNILSNKLYE